MILTVCPNPSIDCTVELPSLVIGKLNRIENKIVTYSGKALNVAIGVRRLGASVTATGFMFNKDSAQFIQSLTKEGVCCDFVNTDGNVRINYKIIDKRSMMTEINDKGELVPPEKQAELVSRATLLARDASVVVMSGSLPQGVDDMFYHELCKNMPDGPKLVLDGEGEKLKNAISTGRVYMIKPNLYELETLTGKKYATKPQIVDGIKTVVDMGVKYVLLSLGVSGAILSDGNTHLYCRSANVAVNSTVGAGDGMVAAASVMLENNASSEEILRCAVAAGTASVTTQGTNLFYKDKYEEIYNNIYVENLI